MKAALLAAGFGTRLAPLTDSCPKVLVPVANQPLLSILLKQLAAAGCWEVALNTHHLGQAVCHFLGTQGPWGINLKVCPEKEILGTGGGLRQLGQSLGVESFLAVNGDILTDLDLADIYRRHPPEALATLVLHNHPPFNKVWLDATGQVVGIGEERPAGSVGRPLAYTGVQVVSREFLRRLPESGFADLVAGWRKVISEGGGLVGIEVSGHFWRDIGTPASYLDAHQQLLTAPPARLKPFFPCLTDPLLGPEAVLEPGVVCEGNVCVGAKAQVGSGTRLKNTVIWPEAYIAPGLHLENCVVGAGVKVKESACNQLLS